MKNFISFYRLNILIFNIFFISQSSYAVGTKAKKYTIEGAVPESGSLIVKSGGDKPVVLDKDAKISKITIELLPLPGQTEKDTKANIFPEGLTGQDIAMYLLGKSGKLKEKIQEVLKKDNRKLSRGSFNITSIETDGDVSGNSDEANLEISCMNWLRKLPPEDFQKKTAVSQNYNAEAIDHFLTAYSEDFDSYQFDPETERPILKQAIVSCRKVPDLSGESRMRLDEFYNKKFPPEGKRLVKAGTGKSKKHHNRKSKGLR